MGGKQIKENVNGSKRGIKPEKRPTEVFSRSGRYSRLGKTYNNAKILHYKLQTKVQNYQQKVKSKSVTFFCRNQFELYNIIESFLVALAPTFIYTLFFSGSDRVKRSDLKCESPH